MPFRASFAFIACLHLTGAFAQSPPSIIWEDCFGGSLGDHPRSIHPTYDGGCVVTGPTYSNNGDVTPLYGGSVRFWIFKLDGNGGMEWEKELGGSGGDCGNSIVETEDHGFFATGYSNSNDGDVTGNHGGYDIWVVRLSSSGELQWQRSLGGSFSDEGEAIRATPDGGCIVAGYTQSSDGDVSGDHGAGDFWVVKLDATGAIQWEKALGGSAQDWPSSIALCDDGGYLIGGYTASNDGDVTGLHGNVDGWLVKLDDTGDLVWQRTLGGSGQDRIYCVQAAPGQGSILLCHTESNDGDVTGNNGGADCWVVRLDSVGDIVWQQALGGSGNELSGWIVPLQEGGYVGAASTTSMDGDVTGFHGTAGTDIWVFGLNESGTLQWQRAYGGNGSDEVPTIEQALDGGFFLAGYSTSGNGGSGDVSSGANGGADNWVARLEAQNVWIPERNATSIALFPNPAHDVVRINTPAKAGRWTLSNALGETLRSERTATSEQVLDLTGLQPALYTVRWTDGKTSSAARLVIH